MLSWAWATFFVHWSAGVTLGLARLDSTSTSHRYSKAKGAVQKRKHRASSLSPVPLRTSLLSPAAGDMNQPVQKNTLYVGKRLISSSSNLKPVRNLCALSLSLFVRATRSTNFLSEKFLAVAAAGPCLFLTSGRFAAR